MKSKLAICLLLLLPSSAAFPAGNADSDSGKLIALENAWNQAQMRKDTNAVEQLLGQAFVYTDYDGQVMDKAKFLADMQDPAYRAGSIVNADMKVYPYQSTAVVVGSYETRGTYKGKAFEHHGRFTDTWAFTKGTWVCVASHISLIK